MENNKIIVVDFGSQYNQLLVRRIRDLGVYAELVPNSIKPMDIKNDPSIVGIVFTGSPWSCYAPNAPKIDKGIFELGLPILGVCYGLQMTTLMLGGKVGKLKHKEYGRADLIIKSDSKLFKGMDKHQIVWMSHGDQVLEIPHNFETIASTDTCVHAAVYCKELNYYGIQFHPEVNDSINGKDLLANFIFEICHAQKNWSMDNYINEQIKKIRDIVGNDEVLCALSGGVDSAVTAALISKAIGNQLTCLFIDHGLLRMNEAEEVVYEFKKHFKTNFVKIDAKEQFLSALKGVSAPEQKRKIIGKLFIDNFSDFCSKHGKNIKWLAQGTLYTDIIESGTNTAQTIKSHHNVGGLPKDLKFKLIEPLNILFKDEVRSLGKLLGLPDKFVHRQPFPGPGLAIRIIGEVTEEKLELVRQSDQILRDEFTKANLDKSVWQYFTVLPGIKTVGVKGDERSYEDVIVIRAVKSIDGMSADFARIDFNILQRVSTRITNEVKGINRVVYDITQKPPGTIEWE